MASPDQVAAAFRALAAQAPATMEAVVGREVLDVEADVKRRAGRDRNEPSVAGLGPRLQTGDYNRSIGHTVERRGGRVEGTVGTNKEQGWRLEKGFEAPGARTLPHPHFGPALETAKLRFAQRIVDAVRVRLR